MQDLKMNAPTDVDALAPSQCRVKHVTSSPVLCNYVEHAPYALANYFGNSIPEVPFEWFKNNILPPLPRGLNLTRLMQKLKKDRYIIKNRWSAFLQNPRTSKKVEDVVYAPLANVAALIGQAAASLLPDREQVVAFQCNPHLVPISNFRGNRSRPDGYGVYKGHVNYQSRDNHEIFWEFIVAPGETKRNDSDVEIHDNVEKILWSFSHIMRDDPSRRFVVGYTIENTDMRLWFCSRADIIVSQPFDFVQDHETLAHFILSQMYAKAHELGYDTTMSTPADTQLRAKNQWDITVHPVVRVEEAEEAGAESNGKKTHAPVVTFRTTELISSIGAEAVRSRGTRVWQAQRLVAGKMQPVKVVMKDYWVDSDRIREADIRLKILKDASTEEDRILLRRHLLTPLYSGDVMVEEEVDSTCALRRSASLSACEGMTMVPLVRSWPATIDHNAVMEDIPHAPRGSGAIPRGPISQARIVLIDDKSHHRIVFKEKGVTIEHLTRVSKVILAGMQALNGLASMHRGGWVHRDISSGNILIADGDVKIADLEYAKNMKDDSSHSERSGTALFMSIEAAAHAYRFVGGGEPESEQPVTQDDLLEIGRALALHISSTDAEESSLHDTQPRVQPKQAEPSASISVFRYNPLHDIESLWWLLVYLLLYRPPDIDGDTTSRILAQSEFYGRFFVEGDHRQYAFRSKGNFHNPDTHKQLHLHEALRPISTALEEIRMLLVKRYIEVEQGDLAEIDHTVATDLIPKILKQLESLRKHYLTADVRLRPIRTPRPQPDPEPLAAATAVGASLDSRQILNAKKRAPSDSDKLKDTEQAAPGVAERKTTKRTKRDKKANRSDGSTRPTRRGASRPRRLGRAQSSGSSSDDAPLRRSQRTRNVKPVKI